MKPWFIRMIGIAGILAGLLPAFTLQPALAAGTVGNGDPTTCTDAAFDAALVGGGTITFNCGPAPVTIPIASTKTIDTATRIVGDSLITLDAGTSVRHFIVEPGVSLELEEINLERGFFLGVGGSMLNNGMLRLVGVELFNNTATGTGGGIFNDGTLVVTDSRFGSNIGQGAGGAIFNASGRTATISGSSSFDINSASLGDGGAIFNDGGTVLISGSADFEGNFSERGGAIANDGGGDVSIDGATFGRNIANDDGGAIINLDGEVTVDNTFMTFNEAIQRGGAIFNTTGGSNRVTFNSGLLANNSSDLEGGAIHNAGALTVTNTTVSSNTADSGGGINNTPDGNVTITRSTFFVNLAFSGGGLANGGVGTIETSTLTRNIGSFEGAGILNDGQLDVVNSTIAENIAGRDGGGIRNDSDGVIDITNTIIAENIAGDCLSDGVFNSLGFNLDGDGSCPFGGASDISAGNANLEPLALNGGQTVSHLPGPGSDAIDNGPATCTSPDQRGESRPRNGVCDIGAVEVVPLADVCVSRFTGVLHAVSGGECATPQFRPVIFGENGPHFLCANPFSGQLSLGSSAVCQPQNRPAIEMPAAAPLAVCQSRHTGQFRLPHPATGCAANEIATTLG